MLASLDIQLSINSFTPRHLARVPLIYKNYHQAVVFGGTYSREENFFVKYIQFIIGGRDYTSRALSRHS